MSRAGSGIYWGSDSIPAEWLAGLRVRDLVAEILGGAGA